MEAGDGDGDGGRYRGGKHATAAHDSRTYTRRRLVVGTAAVLLPSWVVSVLRQDSRDRGNGVSTPHGTVPPIGPADTSPAGSAGVPAGSPVAPQPVRLTRAVGAGSVGVDVVMVQDRLRELAFDPGPSDGVFGPATERAVWAFEKFILHVPPVEVEGRVNVERWQRMREPISVRPRRASVGAHLEVLLPLQVAVLYVDNVVRLITHVSTGSGERWCDRVLVDEDDGSHTEQRICGVATTPGGVFHFERRVTGWRNSKLGRLYNPVHFNYGIAVHGASNVPSYPASHGCVRIPMHIAEYFPSLVQNGDLVYVFDGVEEPETYGAQLPVFDYPDPAYTTTTTSSVATAPTEPATSSPESSTTG